ncbi:MAG: HAMP domain-containing histidine kinase [Clostridiales bacterium]|nr:HAMP domain-containing histidine kinase [Clostridiales bacterium]
MGIKLKRKKAINKRILFSFILVLVISFLITTIIYSVLSKRVIIYETRSDLKLAAETAESRFIEYIERSEDQNLRVRGIKIIADLELSNNILSSNTIVIGNDGNIVYPKQGFDRKQLETLREKALIDDERYIFYQHTFTDENIPFKSLIILKQLNDIKKYRNIGLFSFLVSFGIGIIIASIMSLIITQKIYKPIKVLKKSMEDYMSEKSSVEVYKSNDEIEELAIMFKALTDQASRLDTRQKHFFQNSSHELKTPLMSIQGYVEAIKDGIIDEDEMDNSLDIIISETQRLKHIVDDVIYLSKIDNLEDEFVLKKHPLKQIIENAIAVTMPLLQASHLEMVLTCDDTIQLTCDYDKMKRVFINLIGNGSRYAKSKMVINVNVHESHLMIDVIDDGKGFEYGQEDTIFDRFYKGKNGGSGIGLSLTKEIVEKHGGTIKAINHMNYGAIFKIEFKLKDTAL